MSRPRLAPSPSPIHSPASRRRIVSDHACVRHHVASGLVVFLLDRNPLDDVAGDAFVFTVVEAGGAGFGVAGEELDVLDRHALSEQVGDEGDWNPQSILPHRRRSFFARRKKSVTDDDFERYIG